MNERQLNILKRLNQTIEYITMVDLASEYNCSRMTISKDVDILEYILNKENVYLERKQGLGIRIFNVDKKKAQVQRIIDQNVMKNDVANFDDRRIKILIYLLLNSKSYTTINDLSKYYLISRTSIYNDLNNLEDLIKDYDMAFDISPKGVRLLGDEVNIRALLANLIIHIVGRDANYIYEYQELRHDEIKNIRYDDFFDKDLVAFFERALNNIELDLKIVINEPYYTNLLTHLIIMTNRIRQGNVLSEDLDVVYFKKNSIYQATFYLIEEIEKYCDIRVPEAESYYIYKYLNSIGIDYEEKNMEEATKREDLFADLLLEVLIQMNYLKDQVDEDLRKRLLLHIRPMLNRLDFNIIIKNPLVNDFKKNYRKDFILIKLASYIVCDQLGLDFISDDEIAYLMSYILIKKDGQDDCAIRTCVICYSGVGTSEFLAKRVAKEFSQLEISQVISFKSYQAQTLEDMDLILSTVKLEEDVDYILVSAFLSDVDRMNIEKKIREIRNRKFRPVEIDLAKKDEDFYLEIFEDEDVRILVKKANHNKTYRDDKTYYLEYKDYFYINNLVNSIVG